jgi:FtsZ-binding cell division protein ZapB
MNMSEGVPPSDNNKYDKVILIQALKEEVDELKEDISHMYSQEEMDQRSGEIIRLEEEQEKIKDEMVTMYHIIMNDGDKYEIAKDQPLLTMVQFNIGLMLEKFKEMGDIIMNDSD